ncbi:MAG: biotin--[acetyl-CoA-carboxylase] ligase [Azospirillaceae bacterium]
MLPERLHLHSKAETGSTNADARALADAGAPAFTLVTATRQTAGRGRRGRGWDSPDGNLYFSLLLRPEASWPVLGTLSMVTALAVAEAVDRVTGAGDRLRLKWPNDVLLDGGKLAGLLLEAGRDAGGRDWAVIGVGLNLVACPPAGGAFPPISLAGAGLGPVAPETARDALAERLLARFDAWAAGGLGAVREAYLARLHRLGGPIRVRLTDDPAEDLTGVFESIDGQGTLLLRRDDGTLTRITAGDVFFGG